MKNQVVCKEPVRIRFKKLANGNKSIYLDVYKNGERHYEFLKRYLLPDTKENKETNREMLEFANAVKAKTIVELQNGDYGFKSSRKNKTNLIQYIYQLADEQLLKTGNKRSYYYTLHSLAIHLEAYKGKKTILQNVDERFIREFIAFLKNAENLNYKDSNEKMKINILSKNTQHNLFKKLAWVLSKALKQNIISVNPINKLEISDKPKEEDSEREYLTVDEIKTLMHTDCNDDMIKKAFLFCCLVGLRYSDVSKMTWADFKKGNDGKTILSIRITKTKKIENFPISEEAMKWLPDKIDNKDLVFHLPKNDNANKKLENWIRSAKITKRITFHCSRHTAATLTLSLGVPIETVSKLLGHTKISTTEIYAKILASNERKAVDKQNGIFDKK